MTPITISTEVQALIDQYKAGPLSERQKAELENKIWLGIPANGIETLDRRAQLGELLGSTRNFMEKRMAIWLDARAGEVLWPLMDKGMSLNRAYMLLWEARKATNTRGRTDISVLQDMVNKYADAPRIPFSHIKGRGNTGDSAKRARVGAVPDDASEANLQDLPEAYDSRSGATSQRIFWPLIRTVIRNYYARKFENVGIEEVKLAQILDGFESEIKASSEDLQRRIREAQLHRMGMKLSDISRADLRKACEILHMDLPPVGKIVDLEKARKQKRKLAALYHPDHGYSDDEVMKGVNEAFSTLERYVASKQL